MQRFNIGPLRGGRRGISVAAGVLTCGGNPISLVHCGGASIRAVESCSTFSSFGSEADKSHGQLSQACRTSFAMEEELRFRRGTIVQA